MNVSRPAPRSAAPLRLLAVAAAGLALASATACFPTEPPSDLQISCRADLDCPAKYVCSAVVSRCVPADVEDPPPALVGTPVVEPSVARAGVTLTVSLAVNEALLSDPVVRVGERRLAVDETGTQRAKLSYRFAYKVAGTEPQQTPVPVTIELVDTRGNASGPLDGGEALFDFTPPPAPDVQKVDRVTYHRIPWGAQETAGARRFWVEALAEATEAGAQVVAYDEAGAADSPTASELGRTVAAVDGSFLLELMRTDRPVVWLVAFDAAGNASPVVDVKDVSWTATLAGKVPGKEFENPHDYELRPWFERRYRQPDARALQAAAPLASRDGASLFARGEISAGAWRRKSVGEVYARRSGAAAAYDAARGRMVLFGGEGWADTWLWDGAAWSKSAPLDLAGDGNPSARSRHAMAYDAGRDRVVLFGGQDINGRPLDDTWEWDGVEWVARAFAVPPQARYGHAMAYDPVRQRVVLFGGQGLDDKKKTEYLADLWEWDGTAWVRGANANPPSGRSGHALAMDSARGRLVLFGGKGLDKSGSTTVTRDTFEYDGEVWAKVPAETPPPARQGAGAAFLPGRGVLLFGGDDYGGAYLEDSWLWDGTDWVQLQTATSPDKRTFLTLVYDSARNRAVVCGGEDETDNLGDTWELDGDTWLARTGPSAEERAPTARSWHAMAQDEGRGVTVLFGGAYGGGAGSAAEEEYLGDTWEWDGTRWRELTPAAGEPSPTGRKSPAMAYDRLRRRVVLFGGTGADGDLSDTWEWDGERWKERTPADPLASPEPRYGHAMAFDDREGELVLFGGTDSGYRGWVSFEDTWLWDGAVWRPARYTGTPPSGRCYHAMAYDRLRQKVVLYGGQTYWAADWMCPPCGFPEAARDTFEWDGARWRECEPEGEAAPTTLVAHAMVYSQRGPVLLFGGGSWLFGGSPLDETWAWDGTAWAQAEHGAYDEGSPEPRSGHTLAYDPARSRAVLFGGTGKDGETLGDTWEWDDASFARPGQVARFAFAAAQTEPETVVRSVAATWVAGGRGQNEGGSVSGVSAWLWDHGAFMPASSGSYAPESPGVVSFRTEEDELAARLLSGPRQEISIAVTPQGTNGTGVAEVAVDQVELEVRYRRPATE